MPLEIEKIAREVLDLYGFQESMLVQGNLVYLIQNSLVDYLINQLLSIERFFQRLLYLIKKFLKRLLKKPLVKNVIRFRHFKYYKKI